MLYEPYAKIEHKDTVKDKKVLYKYLGAFMLGDGGVYFRRNNKYSNKNAYYTISQREDHLDYILWQSEVVRTLTSLRLTKIIKDNLINTKPQYRIDTLSHPTYTKVREQFYIEGKKQVSSHYLKMFDWEVAAIWFIDDGDLRIMPRKTKEDYYRVRFSTHGFTYGDNLLLKRVLWEKLSIPVDIHREKGGMRGSYYYRLHTNKDHAKRFIDGISKYVEVIAPSYLYKIDGDKRTIESYL